MASIVVTAGQNPPANGGTPGVVILELGLIVDGAESGYLFNATVDISGSNPVPGMRAAIKAAAIAEAALHGNVFSGSDKVVSLVDPVVN